MAIQVDEPSRTGFRGDAVTFDGRVTNHGNATDYVRLHWEAGEGDAAKGISVSVVAHGVEVAAAATLDFLVNAEIASFADPGTSMEIIVVAVSDANPKARVQVSVTIAVEAALEIRIDADPVVQMAAPGEEVAFAVSISATGNAFVPLRLVLDVTSHQAFVSWEARETVVKTAEIWRTSFGARIPTAVVDGTVISFVLRSHAPGFNVAAETEVRVVVSTTSRLTFDATPFPSAWPGDRLLGAIKVSNGGAQPEELPAPWAKEAPTGPRIGPFSPTSPTWEIPAGGTARSEFIVSVGEQTPPGLHELAICFCGPDGQGVEVPLSIVVNRTFNATLAAINGTAVTGPDTLA